MVLVKPATVIQWHRQGFRLFWRWRSRSWRPSVEREIRDLIRQMSSANHSGAPPRRAYQARHRGQPSDRREVHRAKAGSAFSELADLPAQSGRRHRRDRYVRCGVRFVSAALRIILAHGDHDASYGSYFCNRVEAMGIKQVVMAARSPWQNAYVERVIGSIRRECLDHIVILNERHLSRVLSCLHKKTALRCC
jgi:putative transposase